LGFEVLPSAANFVFARHQSESAESLASALREQGLIVRHFKQQRIDQFLRITVGTEQQNQSLIDALVGIIGDYPALVLVAAFASASHSSDRERLIAS
jgi:histidinol-phosphate aminotransferase